MCCARNGFKGGIAEWRREKEFFATIAAGYFDRELANLASEEFQLDL
jgi:hypothetical protein